MNLIGFSGSLRKGSHNTALLQAVGGLLPASSTLQLLEMGNLPLFSQDLENDFPQIVTDLKAKIRAADGIIIATPEYNRSIPGVLKNMIDWTSRPYGDSAWKGKPVLVMGATGGHIGTALAQAHLKNILLYLDCHLLGQPEVYVGAVHEKFDAQGVLTDEKTKELLAGALKTFTEFAAK